MHTAFHTESARKEKKAKREREIERKLEQVQTQEHEHTHARVVRVRGRMSQGRERQVPTHPCWQANMKKCTQFGKQGTPK